MLSNPEPAYAIREAYGRTLADDRYQDDPQTAEHFFRVPPRGPFASEQREKIAAERYNRRGEARRLT